MAATTLNVVYWHIRNILLLLLYHSYFYFCANLPGSRFSLFCDYKGPIHTNVYDCNYLHMFFVSIIHTHKYRGLLDILISTKFSSMQDSIEKISKNIH